MRLFGFWIFVKIKKFENRKRPTQTPTLKAYTTQFCCKPNLSHGYFLKWHVFRIILNVFKGSLKWTSEKDQYCSVQIFRISKIQLTFDGLYWYKSMTKNHHNKKWSQEF